MKEQPCVKCPDRNFYARFDMHISGEDCPYVCEEYEKWKAEQDRDISFEVDREYMGD